MSKIYDLIINLGSNCQVAYQLKRHKLRPFSGPLDWFVSGNACNIIKSMQDNFIDLFDDYEIVGENNECYLVNDLKHEILSVHDFHLNQNFNESYYELKQKIKRRSERLFEKSSLAEKILVVRLGIELDYLKEFLISVEQIIHKNIDILFINYGPDTYKLDYDKVIYTQVPHTEYWEGDNRAWDYILDGIKLKGE